MPERLLKNINRIFFLCLLIIFMAQKSACAADNTSPYVAGDATETTEENIEAYPYTFEEVWKAILGLIEEGAFTETENEAIRDIRTRTITDRDSGFISYNILREIKYIPPIFIAHSFLIKKIENNKTQVFYKRISYQLAGGPTPPIYEYRKFASWGCLVGIYIEQENRSILKKIRDKLRGNFGEKY